MTHPLGMTNNPEWDGVRARMAELHIADDLRQRETRRRFGPVSFAIAMVVLVAIAAVIGAG